MSETQMGYRCPLCSGLKEIAMNNDFNVRERVQVKATLNKPPLNRGTADIPLLCPSHEKDTTHFTPFKWWFVENKSIQWREL